MLVINNFSQLIFSFFYIRQNESSSNKQPRSLQIANSLENIIENNILQQAGTIRG